MQIFTSKYSMILLARIISCSLIFHVQAGVPSPALFYDDQIIDHHDPHSSTSEINRNRKLNRWSQRYYASSEHFAGPGSPIFLIMGGEEEITPDTGLMYPFIVNHLAREFGAYVVQPEHRFYGASQPMSDLEFDPEHSDATTSLMTSEQAMWDAVRLVQYIQTSLGCSVSKNTDQDADADADTDTDPLTYCPVITVGGSYPGFLAAAMRLRHPNVVDMAYSGSAPMGFYAQQVNQYDYYNHITKVTEETSPGCQDAVRSVLVDALGEVMGHIQSQEDLEDVASLVGICDTTIPAYITNSVAHDKGAVFYDELIMVVGYTFANYNMGNYPPGDNTDLYRACQIFQDETLAPMEKLAQFLRGVYMNMHTNTNMNTYGSRDSLGVTSDDDGTRTGACFNMTSQLPSGNDATITAGDWSGVGTGRNGQMWDFSTCHLLIEQIGFGPDSMFPPRPWTMDWMNQHCQTRFGIMPDSQKLVREWGIDDLVKAGASRILFTNGLKDGWSVGGIQSDLSETILAINFENGAHHSDLSGAGPSDLDTPDIKRGFEKISKILRGWLDEVITDEAQTDSVMSKSQLTTPSYLRKKHLETDDNISITAK